MLEAVNENWTTCFGCNLGEATTFLGLVLPPPPPIKLDAPTAIFKRALTAMASREFPKT